MLDFANVDGGEGAWSAEERDYVCAACYGGCLDLGAEGGGDVFELRVGVSFLFLDGFAGGQGFVNLSSEMKI